MASEQASGDFGAALTAVRSATESMVARRKDADARAQDAIEAVERQLVSVLGGEVLRGLPDLGDGIYGLRIGVEGSAFAKLPVGRPVLVLEARGLLVMATLFASGAGFTQRAPRGTLRASALIPYVRAVSVAVDAHLQSADRRSAEFVRVSELSDKIARAMA